MNNPTNPTPSPELLPCPFCGEQVEESGLQPVLVEHSSAYLTEWSVRCPNCSIEVGDEYRDEAIAAWNTRTSPRPPSADLVERVRDFVYDCTTDDAGHGWTLSREQTERLLQIAALPTHSNDAVEAKETVTLAECPVGLFWSESGELCLKTEYQKLQRIDAYIVSTGEFFWGAQPQTIEHQRRNMVVPIDTDAAFDALSTLSTAAPTGEADSAGLCPKCVACPCRITPPASSTAAPAPVGDTRTYAQGWDEGHACGFREGARHMARHQPTGDDVVAIAEFLVDQTGEPWTEGNGVSAARVHYWRDKAIEAAKRLEALSQPPLGQTR